MRFFSFTSFLICSCGISFSPFTSIISVCSLFGFVPSFSPADFPSTAPLYTPMAHISSGSLVQPYSERSHQRPPGARLAKSSIYVPSLHPISPFSTTERNKKDTYLGPLSSSSDLTSYTSKTLVVLDESPVAAADSWSTSPSDTGSGLDDESPVIASDHPAAGKEP